jgi:hypothetical protein
VITTSFHTIRMINICPTPDGQIALRLQNEDGNVVFKTFHDLIEVCFWADKGSQFVICYQDRPSLWHLKLLALATSKEANV